MVDRVWDFAVRLIKRWVHADGFGLAASMSFYTLFSFAPMIVFALMIAGRFLGEASAREAAAAWLDSFVAASEASALVAMVSPESFTAKGWIYATISGVTLAWAATLIFVRLRISVNRLLGFRSATVKQAVKHSLIGRAVAAASALVVGLIFAAGIVATSWAPRLARAAFPDLQGWAGYAINVGNGLVLLLAVAAIMRFLAAKPPSWRSIWIGSLFVVTAFEVGRFLINIYLAGSEIASAYGAANTLVVFLLWIYYSSQMVLFGVAIAGTSDGENACDGDNDTAGAPA